MNKDKVRFVQDDDCHWYLIPAEDYGMFVVTAIVVFVQTLSL